jgi:hypothetical protein
MLAVLAGRTRARPSTEVKVTEVDKMRMIVCVLSLSILITGICEGRLEAQQKEPPIRDFDIKTIEMLGRQIFEQDTYAARATDILLGFLGDPDELSKQQIGGWIVVARDRHTFVRFAKNDGDSPRPAYDIMFESPKHGVLMVSKEEAFTESELAQFKAIRLVIENIPQEYSPNYNTVVLPDPAGKGLLVYALAATTEDDQILVGGHYRFSVSATGEKISQIDRLFKAFLVLPVQPTNWGDGNKAAGYAVTHIISDTPLETHVFLSLTYKQPFYVTTRNNKLWKVADGHITQTGDLDQPDKPSVEAK